MINYHFRGYPEYVDEAARDLGRPNLAGPARRIEALSSLSNLCAQAMATGGSSAVEILVKAAEFRDHIRIASKAAERMLRDVESALLEVEPIEDRPADGAESDPNATGPGDPAPSTEASQIHEPAKRRVRKR